MSSEPKKILVISALRGGAAEVVLRTICQNGREGDKIDQKSKIGLSRLGFVWRDPTKGVSLAQGTFRTEKEDFDVLLVLGGNATGLFLNDLAKPLSRGRPYSMAHDVRSSYPDASYVVRISPSILTDSNNHTLRRAANEICGFMVRQHNNFAVLKEQAEAAESERQKRRLRHLEEHEDAVAKASSPIEKEHFANVMW